jgi:hypothetical protein
LKIELFSKYVAVSKNPYSNIYCTYWFMKDYTQKINRF